MRPGKLTARDLRERIFPFLGRRDDVLVHATVGQDCAILDFGPSVCVVTTDPITGAGEHLGRLAVHVACNDLATTGAEPVGLLLTLLLAEATAEADLEAIMREAGAAARAVGVEIVGGHTEVTPGLPHSIVVTAAIGRAPRDRYVSASGGRPGEALVLTKTAGIEGTAILAADLADRLRGTVDEATLARARAFIDRISVVPDGRIGARFGATAMHDVTEGGVLTGAWELADASGCGVRLDADAVPVAPETRVICDALGADPLALISSGAMLIAVPDPWPLQTELARAGIASAVIGTLVERERVVTRDGRTAELAPPDRDELWRLLEAAGVG
ncbi:MAG: AIR synthase family protein [Armatimonadota bacterium]|nr:AIR synthase family protein [Armatimonadota bacterium]MDR7421038.1 AIR synthase family protein [Armatimonadota bacterium]MDR7453619.1 AIR synthase family protein [Armatimonadota bacterium]MDR7456829.1 AIR synthase family protein [Armatimonadota bacterium]MDR7495496.1 AIR synthase family protein [Armatimonadota bacterium]